MQLIKHFYCEGIGEISWYIYLHFASIAFVNFIDVRDELDALTDDEEDHNDDQDSGHAGFLNQYLIIWRHGVW